MLNYVYFVEEFQVQVKMQLVTIVGEREMRKYFKKLYLGVKERVEFYYELYNWEKSQKGLPLLVAQEEE